MDQGLEKIACPIRDCGMVFWVEKGEEPRYCPFCGVIISLG